MTSQRLIVSLGTGLLLLTSATFAAAQDVRFSSETLYPESITWSAEQNLFFVGSVVHGTVGTVSMDGQYTPLVNDEQLTSTFGVRVDDARSRLWVTTDDLGVSDRSTPATTGTQAAVAVYDSKTGERLAYHDMTTLIEGPHMANDVAIDADGNAYITDSYAHVIYRIDTDGTASIFAQSPLFATGEGVGLNGIVYNPAGFLLVGTHNSGQLFRINLADRTKVDTVQLPASFQGMDGITLVDGNHLFAAINAGQDKAVELVSEDGWASATVAKEVKSQESFPGAVTANGSDVWIINSRLDNLFDPAATKVSDYLIQKFQD